MAENMKKKKADGKRVAMRQGYERQYLGNALEQALSNALAASQSAVDAARNAGHTVSMIEVALERLRAGFPVRTANREARKGKK